MRKVSVPRHANMTNITAVDSDVQVLVIDDSSINLKVIQVQQKSNRLLQNKMLEQIDSTF